MNFTPLLFSVLVFVCGCSVLPPERFSLSTLEDNSHFKTATKKGVFGGLE